MAIDRAAKRWSAKLSASNNGRTCSPERSFSEQLHVTETHSTAACDWFFWAWRGVAAGQSARGVWSTAPVQWRWSESEQTGEAFSVLCSSVS